MAVHRNTSAKAARDALGANYPVVRAIVGEEAFAACAGAYVRTRPPREPRLCNYGDAFASHLTSYDPFEALPYLADVARLERLCVEALFAADADALRGAAFADGVDPDARLTLHPAIRLAAFAFPAAGLWLAHQEDAPPDALDRLIWRAEAVLVTRPGASLQVRAVDDAALAFLTACQAGETLAEAALAASRAGGDLAATFAMLIDAGAFASNILQGDLS